LSESDWVIPTAEISSEIPFAFWMPEPGELMLHPIAAASVTPTTKSEARQGCQSLSNHQH